MTTTANDAAVPPTIHHFFDDFNAFHLSFRVQTSWLFCQCTPIIGRRCEELVKELCGFGGGLPAEAPGICSLARLVAAWGKQGVRGEERVNGATEVDGRVAASDGASLQLSAKRRVKQDGGQLTVL
jgi:hypothetical protein